MELMVSIVEWPEARAREATARAEGGRLLEGAALDAAEEWIESFSLEENDSFGTALAVSEAYDSVRKHLAPPDRDALDAFMNATVWEGGPAHPNDLEQPAHPDAFLCSIAPARVQGLATIGATLVMGPGLRAAAERCPEAVFEDCDLEQDFLPFVRQFVPAFVRAAAAGRGVLIRAG